MKHQGSDIEKMYFYVIVPFESKYQLFIKRREKVEIKQFKSSKGIFDYSQANDDDYKNLKTTTQLRKKVLIVFDDKISLLVAFLFLRKNKSFSR